MSKPLDIRDLIEHSIATGAIIQASTGYGSRLEEILADDWSRLGLQGPGQLKPPFWSLYPYTDLPEDRGDAVARRIHRDAIAHGAQLVLSGTWVRPESLLSASLCGLWRNAAAPVFRRAVKNLQTVTQEATAGGEWAWDIGAFGSITDSKVYDDKSTPSLAELTFQHTWTATALSGTQMLWGETACNAREAQAMIAAMAQICQKPDERGDPRHKPWGISLTPQANGDLRDGTKIEDIFTLALTKGASVVGVNCVAAGDAVRPIERLLEIREKGSPAGSYRHVAIAVFPNGPGYRGEASDSAEQRQSSQDSDPLGTFKENIQKFADMGVHIIGGCCGTTSACGDVISGVVRSHNRSNSRPRAELSCV